MSCDPNLARIRILNGLEAPAGVIQTATTIATFTLSRGSARIGMELLAELLGHEGQRKFAQRALNDLRTWENRANVITCNVKRGERNVRGKVTEIVSVPLNDASLWISQQLKPDGRPALAQIDELVEPAITRFLRQPLAAVKPQPISKPTTRREGASVNSWDMDVPLSDAARAALSLSLGVRVFPLDGKVPKVWKWIQAATSSEPLIRRWAQRWPDANWAILCGVSLPGGGFLVVLDMDRHDGKFGDGFITLALREEDIEPLPETFSVRTGGNGEHRYFRSRKPVSTSKDLLGPALDVKGRAGFVVAPGAPGYEVIEDGEIAWLPEAWESALTIKPESKRKALAGERHAYLCGVAFAMAKQAHSEAQILNTLRRRLEFNCEKGEREVTDLELQQLAASAVVKVSKADRMLDLIVA